MWSRAFGTTKSREWSLTPGTKTLSVLEANLRVDGLNSGFVFGGAEQIECWL